MKKMLLGTGMMALLLSGCQGEEKAISIENGNHDGEIEAEERFEMGDSFNRTRIFVDKQTGCSYLFIKAANAGGLSPLYDEEGNIDCKKPE